LNTREADLATKRLRIFARICVAWALIIIGRLVQLQIIDHQEYLRLAQRQQERQVEIRAPRGAIFDRNGQPLAMSVAVDSVCINPLRVPDLAVAAEILSKVLLVDGRELLGKMQAAVENRRGFLWVKRKVSPEEAAKLGSYGFDWVEFRSESSRYYPKNGLAAHVLGGVDHEEKGNAGIELELDNDLRGVPGIMQTTADVRQHVFDLQVVSDPQPGASVTLTIDERIQYVAERELASAVKEHGAGTGSIVVVNPNSGDILALANYPSYDPNTPPKSKEEFLARRNLAVTAPFEPGSVFKVITVAAGIETGEVRPKSMFHCGNGSFKLFRRVIHDAKPHGMLTVAEILAKSSNIGAIKVALEVGNARMYDFIRAFGFGERVGLPLPAESAGIFRNLNRWIPSSIGSLAMGHEISTTSVQLAQACSVVANGGLRVKPRLVLQKQSDEGTVEQMHQKPERVLKPETANTMRLLMRGVVDEGTGKRARLRGYTTAGKTGSAQIYDYDARVYTHRYNASFMGFAPVNNPAIVVVVTLNGTHSGPRGFGGVAAAPVFQRVASAALRILGVPKDLPDEEIEDNSEPGPDAADPEGAEPPDPEPDSVPELRLASAEQSLEQTDTVTGSDLAPFIVPTGPKVPDFQGKTKRAVLAESTALGVTVELAGTGIARAQNPLPGEVLRPGERVRVQFTR
jgi:cell division protein FtsI (penicillin-binding protein 3)